MSNSNEPSRKISTTSVEDGLDFACSLLSGPISDEGESRPDKASLLLRTLTQYLTFRYVGELELALEYLADLARSLSTSPPSIQSQFWPQLCWVATELNLPTEGFRN